MGLVLVVDTHDAEAGHRVEDYGGQAERAYEQGPVVAGDDDEQKQDGEHGCTVQQGAVFLDRFGTVVGKSLHDGAGHHDQQERQPEHGHAGSAEILGAGEDIVP